MATIDEAQIVSALDELETLYHDLAVDYKADKPVSVIETWVEAIEDQRKLVSDMAKALREPGTIRSSSKKLSVKCYTEKDIDCARALMDLFGNDELKAQALARASKLFDMKIGAFNTNPIEGFDIEDYIKPDRTFRTSINHLMGEMESLKKAINWHLDAIGMAHLDDSVDLVEAMELMDALLRRDIEEYRAARKEAGL